MQITTPNKIVAVFKDLDDLTFGEQRELQKIFLKGMDVSLKDIEKQNDIKINGAIVFDLQDKILEVVLKELKYPDGKVVKDNLLEVVLGLKPEDGQAIYNVVEEVMTKLNDSKKK